MSLKSNHNFFIICPKEVMIYLKKVSFSKEIKPCNIPNYVNHKSVLQHDVSLRTNENAARKLTSKPQISEQQKNCAKVNESESSPLAQDSSFNPESERDGEFVSGETTLCEDVWEEITIRKIKEDFSDSCVGNDLKLIKGQESTVDGCYKILPQDCTTFKEEYFDEISIKDEVTNEFSEDPSTNTEVDGETHFSKSEDSPPNIHTKLLQRDSLQVKEICVSFNTKERARFTCLAQSSSKGLASGKKWSKEMIDWKHTHPHPQYARMDTENDVFICSSFPCQNVAKRDTKRYFRTDRGERPFKCNSCSYQTARMGDFKKHLRTHTGEKPFECSLCSYRTARKGDLKRHSYLHSGEKPFKCNICPYQALTKFNMECHLRTHTGEKPFKCTLCPYQSAQKRDIVVHLSMHTGEKPFKCSICSYHTARKGDLEKHLITHNVDKPFKCSLCTYQCAQKRNIVVHLSTHTGEKPFKCSICSYETARKGDLGKHLITHNSEKPFKCSLCLYQASTKNSIEKHLITHSY